MHWLLEGHGEKHSLSLFNSHLFYVLVFRFLSKVDLTEVIDEDKLLIRLGGAVSISNKI